MDLVAPPASTERIPQLVVLMGIPATGKTSFAVERFGHSHLRISRDVLRTKHRERQIFDAALRTTADIVLDNTNVTREQRARFIAPAKEAGYAVDGYFLQSRRAEAMERNARRAEHLQVPDGAVGKKSAELELPSAEEGFDRLYFVRIDGDRFIVEDWQA